MNICVFYCENLWPKQKNRSNHKINLDLFLLVSVFQQNRQMFCWLYGIYWICLVCLKDAVDEGWTANCNKIWGFKSWLFKWFLHRPGLMWNRFFEMSRPTLLAVFHTQLSSSFYFSFLLRVCLPTRISVFLLHRPVVVTLYL